MVDSEAMVITQQLEKKVIDAGICVNCGLCVALDQSGMAIMRDTDFGPLPVFSSKSHLPNIAWEACPGKGIQYADLYRNYYGSLPNNWLLGKVKKVRVG